MQTATSEAESKFRDPSIADRPILADPNKNTSTHVFSNIFDNSALISHLSRHVSQQVGE